MVTDWTSFKEEFKIYIITTVGLFTYSTPQICFDLDRFLQRQYNSLLTKNKLGLSQIEMLMALSTFIDILESKQKIDVNIFTKDIIIYLNVLIDTKHIQINPFSNIFKEITNYHFNNNKYVIEI